MTMERQEQDAVRPVGDGIDLTTERSSLDPGKQRRIAEGIPVVPAFDGFRAYAVLGVLLVHILIVSGFMTFQNETPGGVIAWGTVGQMLDMLFIISGFVIYLPVVARGGRFGSVAGFAIRRAARLLPAYWLVLTLILILLATVPLDSNVPFPSGVEIALNYTFLEVPAEFFRNQFFLGFGIDRAIWTMWSEVCFYLLLPFVAGWYFRHPFIGLGIAAVVTSVWKGVFLNLDWISAQLGFHMSETTRVNLINAADIQFFAWVFSIALGMTGAWVFVRLIRTRTRAELERLALPVQVASFVCLALFAYWAGVRSTHAPFLTAPEAARHSVVVALGLSASLATFMVSTALGRSSRSDPSSASAPGGWPTTASACTCSTWS